MIASPFNVIRGAYEWFGFDLTLVDEELTIGMGRVGRSSNPLVIEGHIVNGGWFFEGTSLHLNPSDCRVDLMCSQDELFIMVRSEDKRETYNIDECELLIPLLFRDSPTEPWYYATPVYGGSNDTHHP